jgi:hypothetical protein
MRIYIPASNILLLGVFSWTLTILNSDDGGDGSDVMSQRQVGKFIYVN